METSRKASAVKKNRKSQLSEFEAEFFQTLAHPLRVPILDELRAGMSCVGERSVHILSMRLVAEQSTLCRQLEVLRNRRLVRL